MRNADDRLEDDEDGYDETENVMRSAEVLAVVRELVVFNDNETGEQGQDGNPVDDGVDVGAPFFLPLRVGGLEDQDCLGDEEDAGYVQDLGGRRGRG